MSAPTTHFERLSFWELLHRHPVQIPVIQRDYAQGRESKTKVLDVFLKALKAAFTDEPVELDFIFGEVKDGLFRPLDVHFVSTRYGIPTLSGSGLERIWNTFDGIIPRRPSSVRGPLAVGRFLGMSL